MLMGAMARNKSFSVGVPCGGSVLSSKKSMNVSVPCGGRTPLSPQLATRCIGPANPALTQQSCSILPTAGHGKENSNVQIVEKKGDVAVWGPVRSQNVRVPRILCYGDSNTVGFFNEGRSFQSYGQSLAAELLEAGVPCEVAVCGLCSLTTLDMLNERSSQSVRTPIGPSGRGLLRMLEEDGSIDLVIIMSGTNDIGMRTNTTTIVQHVAQLHALCHERGVPPVVLAPTQGSGPACRLPRQQLADLLFKWASNATGVLDCVDVEDLVPRPVGKDGASSNPSAAVHWEPDDLHFSAAGSMALGQRLAPHVTSWLQQAASKSLGDIKSSPLNGGLGLAGGSANIAQKGRSGSPNGAINTLAAVSEKAAGMATAGGSLIVPAAVPSALATAGKSNSFSDKVSGVSVNGTKVQPKVPFQRQVSCGFSMVNAQRKFPRQGRSAPFPSQRIQLC